MLGAPAVVIVEHDESVRESLPDLLNQLGYAAQTFTSAEQFLASRAVCEARCLLLEIGLPGMSGPELHRELMRRGFSIPTIFMTGHVGECSIPHGPLEWRGLTCLFKPFSERELRAALESALLEK